MTTKRLELPPKLIPLFSYVRGALRYRCAEGGRGSGKSFTFAKMAAIWGAIEPLRILCVRELQVSIKESFHAEIKNAIASDEWLSSQYDVGEAYIRGFNGTDFIFKGLRHNMGSIKSMSKIDLCIVEEAEDVPEYAWIDLLPTIRSPKSEVWVVWNRKHEHSPVDTRFIKQDQTRSMVVTMNYDDNPWFPDVLNEQRLDAKRLMSDAMYLHIWEGDYLKNSESQIFNNKFVDKEFEVGKDWEPLFGMDWGFANDPTTAVECYVVNRVLYIRREAGKVGLELDDTGKYVSDRIPNIEKNVIRADCARPESISHVKKNKKEEGFVSLPRITGCKKWSGSVEDGIEHMRSYESIVIHPDCKETLTEFRKYSYKIHKQSGDILPDIVDAFNHYIDAIRYALGPLIKAPKTFFAG